MALLGKIYNFFSGYLLAIILLTFLLVLTYFGTMAQVEMGLYEASDKYFESLFLVQEVGSSFHILSYELGPFKIVLKP